MIAFIFADLIVLLILNIYRKYYGLMAGFLLATFYVAMVTAALSSSSSSRRWGSCPRSETPRSSRRDLELHDRPQHHLAGLLPCSCCASCAPVASDVADDGQS